jgi:hypothetical protein
MNIKVNSSDEHQSLFSKIAKAKATLFYEGVYIGFRASIDGGYAN